MIVNNFFNLASNNTPKVSNSISDLVKIQKTEVYKYFLTTYGSCKEPTTMMG